METNLDFYAILQVEPDATEDQIRHSYRTLVRQYHPDVNSDPKAEQIFRQIQEAYEILADPEQRYAYDRFREEDESDGNAAISLRTLVSHKYLQTNIEEQAYYVLLDVAPTATLSTSRLPLNLCLVLDRSVSMRGARLQQVKEGARQIIDSLNENDSLSLVVFSDRAEVILPSQRNMDKARAKSITSTIQPHGGTEMFQGLKVGLKQLEQYHTSDAVNHLILLTDGQTYGDEEECLEKAGWAGRHQISLTTMGVGSDWNEELLDQMATASGGSSVYIDSPDRIVDAFKSTISELSSVVARDLKMNVNTLNGVSLSEVFQVTPYIQQLEVETDKLILGPLAASHKKTLLMEYRIHSEPTPGKKCLMRLTMEGDVPGQLRRRNWEWVELFGEFVPELETPPEIPRPIVTNLGKLAIFKMKDKAMQDLAIGKVTAATKRFEMMATQLLNLGETELARTALLEAERLARTGELSAMGRKKIHYGTRALSLLPQQLNAN